MCSMHKNKPVFSRKKGTFGIKTRGIKIYNVDNMPDIYYILTIAICKKVTKKKGEVFSESIRKPKAIRKKSLAAAMRDNWQLYIY